MMLTRIEHNPGVTWCGSSTVRNVSKKGAASAHNGGSCLPYGKPLRESNREFNGTDGVRTYIRIVPLSLRQALLVRPQRLPRSLGPDDQSPAHSRSGTLSTYREI